MALLEDALTDGWPYLKMNLPMDDLYGRWTYWWMTLLVDLLTDGWPYWKMDLLMDDLTGSILGGMTFLEDDLNATNQQYDK